MIAPDLWRQFVAQIEVTKEIYSPYKQGNFIVLKQIEGRGCE
jgi:hypothetical protein